METVPSIIENPLYVVHSSRHNMADGCDLAGVHLTDTAAILGHLNTGASEKHYDSEVVKRTRPMWAMDRLS